MIAILSLLTLFLFTACEKDGTKVVEQESLSADQDVAESVAGTVGENTGGAVDQIGDVSMIASLGGLSKTADFEDAAVIDKSYNDTTGFWTVHLIREHGSPNGLNYAYAERTYTFQFLNKDDNFQKYYITGSDTAYTIKFNIVSGSGRHKTRRLSQELLELNGAWVITNANQPNITINGSYHRAATDTIRTFQKTRTHYHTTDLTFIDIVTTRASRWQFGKKLSGTITGHYHSEVTFDGPRGYSEKTVDRDFTIVFGNDSATITINGNEYKFNISTGELSGDAGM
jgi:hypothetical protein